MSERELQFKYGPTDEFPDPGTMIHIGCGGEITGGEEGMMCHKCGEFRENQVRCFVEERDGNDVIQRLCYEEPGTGLEHFFCRIPALPDVIDDGYVVWKVRDFKVILGIDRGDLKMWLSTPDKEYCCHASMLCALGYDDPTETHHVQGNKIVRKG